MPCAVAFDGLSLKRAFENERMKATFVEIIQQRLDSVVFSRLTAYQKAQVMLMARSNLKLKTLAIGDGFND